MGSALDSIAVHIPGLHWPQADEDALRAEAAAWRAMAQALRSIAPRADAAARSVSAGNSGDAVDAFEQWWSTKYMGGQGAFPVLEQACDGMAKALDQYADAVVRIKHQIEEKAAEAGAALAVGTALAIFTGGLSEGAADAAAAGIVAWSAEAVGVTLADAAAAAITDALSSVMVGAVSGLAGGVGGDLVAQAIRVDAFHDGGFNWGELEHAALGGVVGGGVTGGLAAGMKGAAGWVSDLTASRPGLAAVTEGFPAVLDSRIGRMLTGGLISGGTAELTSGHATLWDFMSGAIGGAVGRRSLPDDARLNMERGNSFNRSQYPKYGNYNEIRLENNKILDSYRPRRDIVSRKYTQLANVKPATAKRYIRELYTKYPPGRTIADTPSNRQRFPELVGQRLRGRMVLEIPVQAKPIPEDILRYATLHRVTLRDSAGHVYDLAHPGGR